MSFSHLDPDDAALARWICGTLEERMWVLEVAWMRYRERILWALKGDFSGLAWQDCQDFAGDAFNVLRVKLENAQFVWVGPHCLWNFLRSSAFNDARDYIRKRRRHAGMEPEIEALGELTAQESGLDRVLRIEAETLKRSYYSGVVERLIESARRMKPAQRSVGALMADSLVASGRWPSNERLLEILQFSEPDLKLSTVKERRKEVLAKFRPILDETNLPTLW